MAVIDATNVRRCKRGDWRTRDPINADDYACIIESSNTLWERIGQTVPGLAETLRTTSATYTQSTSGGPDLDQWDGAAVARREIASTNVLIRLSAWITDAKVRVTVYRRDDDGTETSIGTLVVTNGTTSKTLETVDATFSLADVSESASVPNGLAVIFYDIEFLHTGTGANATLELWHLDAFTSDVADIP